MNPIILIYLLFRATNADHESYETALAIKRGIQDYNDSVAIGVHSFKELVKKSKIFVDTSLFIEQALNYKDTSVLLLGPKGWGKTINLDMLKTFLEIEVDDQGNEILPKQITSNYKLFVNGEITSDDGTLEKLEKPLLIADRENLINLYQGNVPVVYISFANVTGILYTTVKKNLVRSIQKAFLSHKYMINVLRNITLYGDHLAQKSARRNLKLFQNILQDKNIDTDVLVGSVQFLCQILQSHFNRDAIVIFDDYDQPVNNILQPCDIPMFKMVRIFRFIDSLNHMSFSSNKYSHLGILAGIFELEPTTFPKWITYTVEDILHRRSPITKYFGFNHRDVQGLLDKHKFTPQLSAQAHKWYMEHAPQHSANRYYNPYSFSNFLKHQNIAHYRSSNTTIHYKIAQELCKFNLKSRNEILSLLSGQPIRLELVNRKFTDSHLFVLAARKLEDREDTFIWFLYRTGYLSIREIIGIDETDIFSPDDELFPNHFGVGYYQPRPIDAILIHVPDNEIALEMSTWMISYYSEQYQFANNLLEDSAKELLNYIGNESSNALSLQSSLQELYKRSNYSIEIETYDDSLITENPIHAIFACVTLKMRCSSLFGIDVYYNNLIGDDIVIARNSSKRGFVVEIKRRADESMHDTFESFEKYVPDVFETLPHLNTLTLIAMKVSSDKTVQIATKVEKKN